MSPNVDLSALGLSRDHQERYLSLVVEGGGDEGVLAARWACTRVDARGWLISLRNLGLAEESTGPAHGPLWFPTPPDVALRGLLNSRQHALAVAETGVVALTQAFHRDIIHAEVGDLVEAVLGPDAVAARFAQLQLGAREEVCAFVDARPVVVNPEDNQAEYEAMERGVRFRVVIERLALEDVATAGQAREALGSNAQVRTVEKVPTKLLVADGSVAMAPLSVRGHETAALVIRAPSLVHSLATLFESVWAGGIPVRFDASGSLSDQAAPGPDALDVSVMSLMLSGLTDAAVGKQLAVSERTVQRRLRALMDLTGATTRMQLGWEIAERQWVTRRSSDAESPGASPH